MKYLLNKKGIAYEERDGAKHYQELLRLTGQTTIPVLLSNNKVITQLSQLSGLASPHTLPNTPQLV